MKHCKYCNTTKPLSEFYGKKSGKFGVKAECKSCTSVYEKKRWQKDKDKPRTETKIQYRKQHYLDNKEKVLQQSKKWAKSNLDKKRIYRANRRANLLKATPCWSDKTLIQNIYKQADLISKQFGIKYEVDHIVPLRGKNVCGLHVEYNLQIITMEQNRMKATKYEDTSWR
jgi:hypothetical protein